ncbi:MAG: TauD/TfdA family dioxygenase [Alphaproteobacteria bacterium]|nr:TauD/TfdA family dioxygenase [Alphaproteobacteria bacterium]MCY4317723.1 TauD/TfdA family dioxygenase [Alphaproteobacteria bacterium]
MTLSIRPLSEVMAAEIRSVDLRVPLDDDNWAAINHASHILGMDREEGEAQLEDIQTHSMSERFVSRHPWHPNDLLMWDNRCPLHRAEGRTNEARLLHRTITRGTAPF